MSDANETPPADNVVPINPPLDVADDLKEKVGALSAIATCHAVMTRGSFQPKDMRFVSQGLDFLMLLHGQMLAEAFTHPDCDKVPILLDIKKEREKVHSHFKDASKPEETKGEQNAST